MIVWSLMLAAICLDSMLAPGLSTLAPAISSGLLLLLVIRRGAISSEGALASRFPGKGRIIVFLLLHAAGVVMARWWQSALVDPTASGLPSITIAVAKYLILCPIILLMPLSEWRIFLRAYRAETIAALLTLFTFYPYRIYHALWPWYSQVLGHAVYWLAHPFVRALNFLPEPSPVLAGPALDVVVIPDCGGLGAIKLFQVMFAIILIADWNSLNKARTAVAYGLGTGVMLAANALRISLLVIIGNRFPQWVVQHHIMASWIFLAAALVICLLAGHRRLLSGRDLLLPQPS
jgi:exosortase/archaeosortase family protein